MTAERYDPKIDKWTMIRPSGIAKCWMGAANFSGKFPTGGRTASGFRSLSTIEMYDDEKDNWISMPSLNEPRYYLRAVKIPWRLAKAVLSRNFHK